MNPRIIFFAIVSALAGFLFGFDTVVISGAEQTIQKLWGLDSFMHGIAMAAALYGTVIGSLIGGWPTERYGRKKTLIWIGLLYFVSAIGSAYAMDVNSFIVARFIGGLGVGISTVAAPLYISEISPPDKRGRLAGMFQFNIVFGILVAFLSNWVLGGIGENAWRWMLGVEAVPALIYMVLCFAIPESPRWLIGKGQLEEGRRVLGMISPNASEPEISATAEEIQAHSGQDRAKTPFWSARLKTPIMLAILIAFFNQLSGINAILYFAPRIFGLTGSENALGQSIGIGVTNLIFTFVGLWLIDRLGRRTLLYIGSFGYILSLGLCAMAFFTWAPQFRAASAALDVKATVSSLETAEPARVAQLQVDLANRNGVLAAATAFPESGATPVFIASDAPLSSVKSAANVALAQASKAAGVGGTMVLICIFAFIAAHAVGQGAVIWVFISEIFPNEHRASGQSLGSFTHWIFAALLTTFFPRMVTAFSPGSVFLFFAFMMVLQLIWVKLMVPETKGIPLEEIQEKLGIH